MTVHVVSYNLLVPKYADRPEIYSKCQPQFLRTNYRWKLIQSQLEQEITHQENTIICIQELSLTLVPKLELFFRRLNYTFFHNLYGPSQSDYMGVAMAIPNSMPLQSMSIIKIGDHIRSISKRYEKDTNFHARVWGLYQYAISKFIQPVSDSWETAMKKSNTLLFLQVVINGKPLCVGTYHMPCLYKEPDVMAIHGSIVKDLMFELSAGHDLILAGDFNAKPQDICYQVLTGTNHSGYRLPNSIKYNILYRPKTEQVLKSAYQEKNGNEPAYTNYADTPLSPKFCATLDYIFFAGHLKVKSVLKLPDQPVGESYPDETHPSDHLMIAATLEIPSS